MPAPGGAPGMGGMSPPGGEISEDLAKMMGSASSTKVASSSGSSGVGSGGSGQGAGNLSPAQMAQASQSTTPPREVTTVAGELKQGFSDIFEGLKNFFKLNTWLGIDADKLDPQEQAHAKQLHSRYQQLDQEQQAVAKQMYEEKMQKKRLQEEEEQKKKQLEEEQEAQAIEMPSGPQKGPVGPAGGKSKKQSAMQRLKQDRSTLGKLQGE